MKKYLLSLLVPFLLHSPLAAQDLLPASLSFKDGKVLQGQIDLPSRTRAKKISFKPSGSSEIQEYASEELAAFTLKLNKDYTFEYLGFRNHPKAKKAIRPAWQYLQYDGYAKIYIMADKIEYKEKKNQLILKEKDDGAFVYLVRKTKDDFTVIGDNDFANWQGRNMHIKLLSWYFQESPTTVALLEKMKSERQLVLKEVVDHYNNWHKQQKAL